MGDSKAEAEKPPLPPEQLQAQTQRAYYSLPQCFPPELHLGEITQERALARTERLFARVHSEYRLLIVEKFDELIAQSPTTASYKKAIHDLVDSVSISGRKPDNSERCPPEDRVLVESLQLEYGSRTSIYTRIGIYTPEGAREGEDVLYKWIQGRLIHATTFVLDLESDPENPGDNVYPGRHPVELRDFLARWGQEYTNLYGEPPSE